MREQKSGPAAPRGTPDKPWIFRTYAGHSSAAASNGSSPSEPAGEEQNADAPTVVLP